MRKLSGTAVAAAFGDGHRITLKASTGEQVCMDLSAEASEALRAQLQPAGDAPDHHTPTSDAQAPEPKPSSRRTRR